MDNTPHVPFFLPIIRELEGRGYHVVISVRDAFQVCELAMQAGLQFSKIGLHYGKNPFLKVGGLLWRSVQLIPFVRREKPRIALSHGARSQVFLANILRIPTVMIMDYEHARTPPLCRPRWEIVPEIIPVDAVKGRKVLKYSGIKEDVYAETFVPDSGILEELGLKSDDLVITVRPPATEAHYHNPESETLFIELMKKALTVGKVKIVLLPRNGKQGMEIKRLYPHWFNHGKTIIPNHAVNGLNLLWHSDLVVSGGGTMNREAAALGVPVYSIFKGPIGAVDRRLQEEGRLTMINSVSDVYDRINICYRNQKEHFDSKQRQALQDIVNHVESILSLETGRTN